MTHDEAIAFVLNPKNRAAVEEAMQNAGMIVWAFQEIQQNARDSEHEASLFWMKRAIFAEQELLKPSA